jgi:hypothetical protein
MTTSQQKQQDSLPLEEKTVADYLRDNPEFFQNNASLLASLEIPHACGPAVSLVEHQVKVLRDQNRQLKRKLMDLVHVARDNNRLNERMHQLTLGLINTGSLVALLDTLREHLQGEFKADTVNLRLAGIPEAQARECGVDIYDPEGPELAHFESFLKSCRNADASRPNKCGICSATRPMLSNRLHWYRWASKATTACWQSGARMPVAFIPAWEPSS